MSPFEVIQIIFKMCLSLKEKQSYVYYKRFHFQGL